MKIRLQIFISVSLFFFPLLWGGIEGGALAQSPKKINYQAVARDASGNPLTIATVTVSFDIHRGSSGGPVSMNETHTATTNQFGLFTLFIGSVNSMAFDTIAWGKNSYFLEVTVNGISMGATQFFSVPYALHAATADSITSLPALIPWTKVSDSLYTSSITDRVGIGTVSPQAKLQVSVGSGEGLDGNSLSDVIINNNNFNTQTASLGIIGGSAGLSRISFGNNINGMKGRIDYELSNDNMVFYTNSSEVVRLVNGRLSVGASAPQNKLHVHDASGSQSYGQFTNTATGNGFTDGIWLGVDASGVGILSYGETGIFKIQTNGLDQMAIDMNGNVGIGTSSPGAKLEIAGQLKLTGGSPSSGKVLVSDAGGLAAWENASIITSATPPPCQTLGAVTNTPAQLGSNLATFIKNSSSTKIEIIFQTFINVEDLSAGALGVIYELRVDGTAASNNAGKTVYFIDNNAMVSWSANVPVNMYAAFSGLTTGAHSVGLYVYTPSGSATNASYDSGCFSTSNVTIKEIW